MSDNEDLLGDDLGDHSLADYNLGNDEEDQLLADDYEGGSTQNVPTSLESFREPAGMVPSDFSGHGMEYGPQPIPYQPVMEAECVVPNIVVEVPNLPLVHSTYAPYEPRHYEPEHSVPPPMPAAPIESPQIVPSEIVASIPNDMSRERFISERPVGAQRLPQIRDIPDSLDKVVVEGSARRTWRSTHYTARYEPPYRRHHAHHAHRGNFSQRSSFPAPPAPLPPAPAPPQHMHLDAHDRPMMEMPRPPFQPDRPMDLPRPPMDMPRPPMDMPRPPMDMPRPPFQQFQRFPFREENPPMFNQMRPQFERPMYFPRQPFQRFGPPMPQVTIRQNLPEKKEPEIRMLPVPMPASLPALPSALAGKKVLINPHFKGNFQPPVEGLSLPAYIPTRIQKSPPLSPTLENKFGPVKDIDDAAERFIAEQRNALARAAQRKFARRSPQRYIENTTIEIENELARRPVRRRSDDDDLLRRQEEFIHQCTSRPAPRRRMRSPSPARSPSPLAPPPRRARAGDEDIEYKRRVREQENMRERVLRAKEVRRRKNAALYIKQMQDREREEKDQQQKDFQTKDVPSKLSDKPSDRPIDRPIDRPLDRPIDRPLDRSLDRPLDRPVDRPLDKPSTEKIDKPASEEETKPDTTRKTPERDWTPEVETKEKSPIKKDDEVNSTCEELTPPRPRAASPSLGSDDELDLILGDIDGILSDDDDILTRRDDIRKPTKPEPPKAKPVPDLRTKLPPKDAKKPQRQKIIFTEERLEKKKKEKSPARRPVVSSTKLDVSDAAERKSAKKAKQELSSSKSRQRIIFENKGLAKPEKEKPEKSDKAPAFSNRRVILQRKPNKESKSVFSRIEITNDPSKPNPGIFSRAVRTIGERDRTERETNRIVIKNEPEIEYDSSSDDEDKLLNEEVGNVATVDNLPHGMTDTRLKTLAGDVQSLILDKQERSAKITFKTTNAAETFKKKFNNKMVAASRLTVTLQ